MPSISKLPAHETLGRSLTPYKDSFHEEVNLKRLDLITAAKNKGKRNFDVNDVVLVVDEKTSRNTWPLGRILEVYKILNNGFVRSVKLKSKTTESVRPVSKIVFLKGTDEPKNVR